MSAHVRTATLVATFAFALLGAPRLALAVHGVLPEQHESVRDQLRCQALGKQFQDASARHPVDDAAKEQASQGEALCRAGRYGEGADTLEKAVRMIGETPGN